MNPTSTAGLQIPSRGVRDTSSMRFNKLGVLSFERSLVHLAHLRSKKAKISLVSCEDSGYTADSQLANVTEQEQATPRACLFLQYSGPGLIRRIADIAVVMRKSRWNQHRCPALTTR